jgi:hypothetical protein
MAIKVTATEWAKAKLKQKSGVAIASPSKREVARGIVMRRFFDKPLDVQAAARGVEATDV